MMVDVVVVIFMIVVQFHIVFLKFDEWRVVWGCMGGGTIEK